MDGLLKCNGCLVNYSDERVPRILICGHSLCTTCVEKFTEEQNSCPECNQKEPVKSIEEYTINYSLLRLVRSLPTKDVHIGRDSVALLSEVISSKHKYPWNCQLHKNPIHLFCYICTSWVCQDCLVVDHPVPPRGTCGVIDFEDALKKTKCKYEEAVGETSKDVESIKERFDMDLAMHTFCLKHCTEERSHLRIIERVEDLIEGERENNESIVQDSRKRLRKLTDSDVTASQENMTSAIEALFSFKEELKDILHNEKDRLFPAMPPMRRHLRLELKRLAERAKPLYAVTNKDGNIMFASIKVIDERLLVYSLQKGKPPEDSVTVPYVCVKNLIPKRWFTVFIEIGTAEESFGRVYTLIISDRDYYLHVEQMLLMCTGEKGVSFKNSKFFKYDQNGVLQGGDYERNDGTGGRTIIEGLGDCDTVTLYEEQRKRGALFGSPLSTRFSFHLKHHNEIVECYIGRVHHGLNFLKAVGELDPVTKGVIRECGAVIPMKPWFSVESNCMDPDDDDC